MKDEYRFNAFGRLISVVRERDRWVVFDLGTEGKRRRANLQIPDAIPADELAQYIGDLLHEDATPRNDQVTLVAPAARD